MTHQEALSLIHSAHIQVGSTWADFGSGGGRFTYALAERIGQQGKVYAIDKNNGLDIAAGPKMAEIQFEHGDFTKNLAFLKDLDGILMANSLHYVRRQKEFLKKIQLYFKPTASLILIEYDRKIGNPWVPYPISIQKLENLVQADYWTMPKILGKIPSRFGHGHIYAAQMFLHPK